MAEVIPRSPEFTPATPALERREVPAPSFNAGERSAPTPVPAAPPPTAPVPVTAPPAAVMQRRVEDLLSEGLEELYQELTPEEQTKFRVLGEATALKITSLLGQAEVKLRELLELIRDWLMTLPGINRYYVEQEAKIKADKILRLRP